MVKANSDSKRGIRRREVVRTGAAVAATLACNRLQESEGVGWMRVAGMQMEAWAPFAEGRDGLFTNSVLEQMGHKHGKTAAQTVLRWHHQRGIIAISHSSNPVHRREDLAIFDFSLETEDLRSIAELDLNRSQFPSLLK